MKITPQIVGISIGLALCLGVQTPNGIATRAAHAAPAPLSEAQLRTFLAQWESAQNKHDFTRYSRLYASDFTGIKRTTSGRTSKYNRTTWLRDRKPMFAASRHLHLWTENAKFRPLQAGGGEIRFEQYFRTKNYGDWGPKVLRVKRTAKGIQIVHEEMLASYLLPTMDCC